MIIKQQINHGTIQKVCHLHNGIFDPIHSCVVISEVYLIFIQTVI